MNRTRLALVLLLAAGLLTACKGDAKVTTFVTSPDAGTVEGYTGGTPITLADGTPVTLANGTPVTSPRLKGAKNASDKTGTTRGIGDSDVASPADGSNSGTTLAFATGSTAVSAKPNTNKLAVPKTGQYGFHQTITPDDGGSPSDQDLFYRLAPDTGTGIRVQETDRSGAAVSDDYYVEAHDPDGLWLTNSALVGSPCEWSPKAAQLPQSIVDGGGKVTTSSSCSTTFNGQSQTFKLRVTISFLRLKTVTIGGNSYKCIDVARHRVLEQDGVSVTSDAVDTYAFDLGMRIATSDHSTTRQGDQERASVRDLTITSLA